MSLVPTQTPLTTLLSDQKPLISPEQSCQSKLMVIAHSVNPIIAASTPLMRLINHCTLHPKHTLFLLINCIILFYTNSKPVNVNCGAIIFQLPTFMPHVFFYVLGWMKSSPLRINPTHIFGKNALFLKLSNSLNRVILWRSIYFNMP